jgi:hypothetical protein
MSELSQHLKAEREGYLFAQKKGGGTAEGFRKRIADKAAREPDKYRAMIIDALMEATTKAWERPAKRRDPDLFCIGGVALPEFFTRPRTAADGEAIEEIEGEAESAFEKVHCDFATIADAYADATIKMRKAAQSSAAAEADMRQADEARRRARGRLDARLVDLLDRPRKAA